VAYDVSFAFELATIIEDGMHRMFELDENIYYYITLQNENYSMPPMPEGAKPGILKGMYRYDSATDKKKHHVQLFGSGSIMMQVLAARDILAERYDVSADIWGVTSYNELRKEALKVERYNRLHPEVAPKKAHITQVLEGVEGPFIAASDYMKILPEQVARFIPGHFEVLGTDGFGMSDTREALRSHFEVTAEHIVVGALTALCHEGKISAKEVGQAIADLGIDPEKMDPLNV
jgi:pyruvate dehydrogenase E1 component